MSDRAQHTLVPTQAAHRWNSLVRLTRQEVRDALLGWGVYVTAAIGLFLASLLLYNSVRFVGESGLSIISRPFFLPLLVATTIALLYVTVTSALAIARQRESGGLQLLFFAPVDAAALVGAHLLAGMLVFTVMLCLLLPPLLLLSYLVNFHVPTQLLWGLLPTILIAGTAVAFGLFLSASAPSGRAAVLLFVGATLGLLLVYGGYIALLNIPPTSRYYDALLFGRILLRTVQSVLLWLSPFQMLDSILSSALRSDWATIGMTTVAALSGMVLWYLAAVWALQRRGALP